MFTSLARRLGLGWTEERDPSLWRKVKIERPSVADGGAYALRIAFPVSSWSKDKT